MDSKKNILIIDDDKLNITMLRNLIDKDLFNIFDSLSGEDGLEVINSTKIDLVFLDIILPGIDGFETCKRIKTIKDYYIPVIFVTSMSEDLEILEKIFNSKGDDYIRKPLDIFTVKLKIYTFLRFKEFYDSLEKSKVFLEEQINIQRKIATDSNNFANEIISSINQGVILFNNTGVIVFENEAAKEIFGSCINQNVNRFFKGEKFVSGNSGKFDFLNPNFKEELILTTDDGKLLSVKKIGSRENIDTSNHCVIIKELNSGSKLMKANHKTLKQFLSSF